MLTATKPLPKVANKFYAEPAIATEQTYFLEGVMSGTKTRVTLTAKKTNELINLSIISRHPITLQALRHAITQATGRTHWDFKISNLVAVDYEF